MASLGLNNGNNNKLLTLIENAENLDLLDRLDKVIKGTLKETELRQDLKNMSKEQVIDEFVRFGVSLSLLHKMTTDCEREYEQEKKKTQQLRQHNTKMVAVVKQQFLQLKEHQRQLENQNTRLRQELARIHEDSGEIIE